MICFWNLLSILEGVNASSFHLLFVLSSEFQYWVHILLGTVCTAASVSVLLYSRNLRVASDYSQRRWVSIGRFSFLGVGILNIEGCNE